MAGRKDNSKQNTASLLLQPPNSGFSWDQMFAGNNILLPASPPSSEVHLEEGAEADSFIGQQQIPTQTFLQRPAAVPHPQNTSATFSQLQQPLRPSQNKSATPPPPPVPPSNVSQMAPNAFVPPATIYSGQPPPFSAPPTGPAQNFRRQAPFSYVAAPGITPSPNGTAPLQTATGILPPQQPSVTHDFQALATSQMTNASSPQYNISPSHVPETIKQIQPHWFYKKEVEKREVWCPFTMMDSLNLEEAYKSNPKAIVITDGGRYDTHLGNKMRFAVYWEEEPMPVKRATWFYKVEGQNRFVPYDEDVAEKIEAHYTDSVMRGYWHQKLELPGNEIIVVQSANIILHFAPSSQPDEWGNVVDGQMRPRIVKRGTAEVASIENGETQNIDHVVFFVHGIGAICDLKFRSVYECVDDFRSIALGLLHSHFKGPLEERKIGRVEFLPISWHSKLHSDATGIDSQLKTITLSSIPKLRYFTNDTLLDILFYTSPVYCQTVVDTVAEEVNRMYRLFLERNPNFCGQASVVGHSLGSLILFDILAHQHNPDRTPSPETVEEPSPPPTCEPLEETYDSVKVDENLEQTLDKVFQELGLEEYVEKFKEEKIDLDTLKFCSESDIKEMGLPLGPRKKLFAYLKEQEEHQKMKSLAKSTPAVPPSKEEVSELPPLVCRSESVTSVSYRVGLAGTGQPSVVYPKLCFSPSCFFALGSPIAMFLTVRGIQTIGEEYCLPTCPAFFNIFHPFDPVAYRIETLIDPQLTIKPVLMPHHKGRKRMHLELRDSLTRMGTDLKQKLMDSLRYTWNSISEFARAHRSSPSMIEEAVDLMVQEQLTPEALNSDDTESTVSEMYSPEDIQIGHLNGGRRIDYVLQEKPIESFNEYLFALASHACYWESEDTALMILKEVYALSGIYPQTPSAKKVQLYNPAIVRGPLVSPPPPNFDAMCGIQTNSPSVPPVTMMSPLEQSFNDQRTSMPIPSQPLGPPPLTGFVRSSAGIKR